MRPILACLMLVLAAGLPLATAATPTAESSRTDGGEASVLRVFYGERERIRELAAFDVWEFRDVEAGFVLVAADAAERADIVRLGFRVEVDVERTAAWNAPPPPAQRGGGIPGYPCYRTVEETYATAAQIAADHPGLAEWNVFGDSWQLQQGDGGYPLRVLRLTNLALPGPKPKLIVTASIHAREYTPAELATRFAERLVAGHGVDPDATWLLDEHEVHLVLQANPDGRKMAEAGLSWRKNTNENYCSPTSSNRGADLNRNFEFEWGCCGGSSGAACDVTYRGPSPASEPEVQAIQNYVLQEFPDQRGDALGDAAPSDASGVYLDLHSFSELVLWPWGFSGSAPNATALRTLGRRLAWFNGYTPQQSVQLYPTDGTTIDFAYGEQGVAAYVFEIGTSFFQDCGTFEGAILPDNLDALFYAARVAREPYRQPAGPDVIDPALGPFLAAPGAAISIEAMVDDTRSENSNGSEPVQAISGAEIWIDDAPWDAGAQPVATMTALDGAFDSTSETVVGTFDTSGLAPGRHFAFVRGLDAAGNYGPVSARFFWIADGTEGSISGTVTDLDGGQPLAALLSVDGLGPATSSDGTTGAYTLSLPAGTWTLRASAGDHVDVTAEVVVSAQSAAVIDFALPSRPTLLVVDDDDDAPDVRFLYTSALDTLGLNYLVAGENGVAAEPSTDDLESFEQVIWFTGDRTGSSAGPSSGAESSLEAWLDASGCLLVVSQDYAQARGVTSFMRSHLGANSASQGLPHFSLTGQGIFQGYGAYSLSLPYQNRSDVVTPAPGAASAFSSAVGVAGVSRDTQVHRASFLAFGLEGASASGGLGAVLQAFLDWCEPLPTFDPDADGVTNADDCAPSDAATWAVPSSARDLHIVVGVEEDSFNWSAPLAPGSSPSPVYDLLVGPSAAAFGAWTCSTTATTATTAIDALRPLPGEALHYLVRARNACGTDTGSASSGGDRTLPACP